MTKDKISCYGLAHLAQIKTSGPPFPPPHPPSLFIFLSIFLFFPILCYPACAQESVICLHNNKRERLQHPLHSLSSNFPEHNTTMRHHKVTDTESINKSFFTVYNSLPSIVFLLLPILSSQFLVM